MYGEHIEEVLNLFQQESMAPNPHDVAMAVADIVFSQGLVEEEEADFLVHQLEQEVPYYLKEGS